MNNEEAKEVECFGCQSQGCDQSGAYCGHRRDPLCGASITVAVITSVVCQRDTLGILFVPSTFTARGHYCTIVLIHSIFEA